MKLTAHWGAGLAVIVVALLVTAEAVLSHAGFDRSEPGRNEVLPEAPAQVDVWFTQDVVKREGLYFVRVLDGAGAQITEDNGTVDDDDRSHVFVELPAEVASGRYIVEWMTTSDIDGDDDDGAFCFYVGVEPTAEQQAECAAFDEEVPPTPTERVDQPTVPSSTDVSPTAVAPPDGAAGDGGGSNNGIIAAVIVGVVIVALALVGGVVWFRRP